MLLELCEIVSQYPQIELHIAGFGILEKSIIEYSKEFDNIYYYGKISYSNTLSLENMCDVMMATYDPNNKNNKYAAPNKFYEALMLGKPIIMSLGTGFDDIINDYGIGQLIVYSKKGLEQGLNELISRKSEWEHISFIEKELYDNNYSWDIMAHRLDGLYSSLLL